MVSTKYSEAAVEVLDILKHTREDDVNKIPKTFMDFLESNRLKTYISKLDHTKEIKDMELKPRFAKDKEIVIEAVRKAAWQLQDVSAELRSDREVVLEAVKHDGKALKYVNEIFFKDKEIVLEALKNDPEALEGIPRDLYDVPEILECIENQRKQKLEEKQHTPQEIAQGIKTTERAIQQVQAEMVAEQAKEENAQTNDTSERKQ